MARDLRARLSKASAQLKADGHEELAYAVDAVLGPGGWALLRNAQGETATTSNLPLSITETLRTRLKDAADAREVSLSVVADEGLRAVAEGRWTPPTPVRVPRGSLAGVKRVALNLRVEDGPRKQVEAMLPALSEAAGRRVTLSHITLTWLREELGVEDD